MYIVRVWCQNWWCTSCGCTAWERGTKNSKGITGQKLKRRITWQYSPGNDTSTVASSPTMDSRKADWSGAFCFCVVMLETRLWQPEPEQVHWIPYTFGLCSLVFVTLSSHQQFQRDGSLSSFNALVCRPHACHASCSPLCIREQRWARSICLWRPRDG